MPETHRHIEAKCESCGAKLRVRVGLKSTARSINCSCGVRYVYSCWNLRELPDGGGFVDKFEAYPIPKKTR
jgi:hypothetical protein